MKILRYVGIAALLVVMLTFAGRANHIGTYMAGFMLLPLFFYYTARMLAYYRWPSHLVEGAAQETFSDHIKLSAMAYIVEYISTAPSRKPFFGWSPNDLFNGFLLGSVSITLIYVINLFQTEESKADLLHLVIFPIVGVEVLAVCLLWELTH